MNIVVCVKQVPDTWAEKKLGSDNTVDRESVDGVMNELDEYAVEEALKIKEAQGGEVTVLTMGPEKISHNAGLSPVSADLAWVSAAISGSAT